MCGFTKRTKRAQIKTPVLDQMILPLWFYEELYLFTYLLKRVLRTILLMPFIVLQNK